MRSLSSSLVACAIVVAGLAAPSPAAAGDSTTASVTVTAQVASRTSLQVSAETLQFSVADQAGEARASIEFAAGARTRTGGDVVLTVEALRAADGPGGAADVETALTFTGLGEGTTTGALRTNGPVVAARWNGSGKRTGTLTFALRSSTPGTYTVPVRFVLSIP